MIIRHDYILDADLDIEPGTVDLVFADPPYNQGVRYADDETGDKLGKYAYQSDLVEMAIRQTMKPLRPGGTFWWLAPVDHVDWLGAALTTIVGPRLYLIAWHETFAQYQGDRGLTKDFRHLYCHVKVCQKTGWHDGVTFNPGAIRIESERQRMGDKRANPAGRVPGTVWRVRRLQGTSRDRVDWHPTQIPPELLDKIILGWTNEGDVVLDAFAGSGSMGVQCLKRGRRFIGVDKSDTYCEKMRERLTAAETGC